MIGRRPLAVAMIAAAVLTTSGCGLGDRQAQADRIVHATQRRLREQSIAAVIAVRVKVLPSDQQLVVRAAPRISNWTLTKLDAVINPTTGSAEVVGSLRFFGDTLYERIAQKVVKAPDATFVAPSNLIAIAAAASSGPVIANNQAAVALTATPKTTSTTAPTLVLRRTPQIVRQWARFDFGSIKDHDKTKHAGSFAINPVDLLRLATGALTGSIERHGNAYKLNVSRDKAERDLSEHQRKVLDKIFVANAITRRVFPAQVVFDERGELTQLSITMRQSLSSTDRADLTVTLDLANVQPRVALKQPGRRGTVTVRTLGELVTTVSGA